MNVLTRDKLKQLVRETLEEAHMGLDCVADSVEDLVQGLSPEDVQQVFEEVFARLAAPEARPIGFREGIDESTEEYEKVQAGWKKGWGLEDLPSTLPEMAAVLDKASEMLLASSVDKYEIHKLVQRVVWALKYHPAYPKSAETGLTQEENTERLELPKPKEDPLGRGRATAKIRRSAVKRRKKAEKGLPGRK